MNGLFTHGVEYQCTVSIFIRSQRNSRPPLNINTECSPARDISAAQTAVSPLFSFDVLHRMKVSINICICELRIY